MLVDLLAVGVEQLLDDVGEVRVHGFAHLRAGIALGHEAAKLDEPMQRDAVELVGILQRGLELLQLLLRVVDQRRELVELGAGDGVGKEQVHPLAHDAGAGVEDMQEGLVLPVHIGDKVLAALREVQDRLEVYDFGACGPHRRELAGQQLQVAQLFLGIVLMRCHVSQPPLGLIAFFCLYHGIKTPLLQVFFVSGVP